jgi:hypothetical protein
MNKKIQTFTILFLITICLAVIVIQIQANLGHADSLSIGLAESGPKSVNAHPGPEADLYLRHCPDCYDFENELPPLDLQLP